MQGFYKFLFKMRQIVSPLKNVVNIKLESQKRIPKKFNT